MINPDASSPMKSKGVASNLQLLFGLGVALFIGVITLAIVALQRGRTTVAPTAPQSRPQAAEFSSNTCTLTFNAENLEEVATCNSKIFQDEFDNTPGFYSLRKVIQTAKAGQQAVWIGEITNTTSEPQSYEVNFSGIADGTFVDFDPICQKVIIGAEFPETQYEIVRCTIDTIEPDKTARVHVRFKISDAMQIGENPNITGAVRMLNSDPVADAVCITSLTIAQTSDQKQCNQPCESDKECSESAGHICQQTNDGYFCRLATDPTDPTCSGPTPTPGNTPVPTATPLASCNASCTRNADCANTNHVCVEIGGQRVCRLASNVNSTTCSSAGATATPVATTPSVTPGLPAAGNESRSTIIILAAGVVVLVLGSLAFLLLL